MSLCETFTKEFIEHKMNNFDFDINVDNEIVSLLKSEGTNYVNFFCEQVQQLPTEEQIYDHLFEWWTSPNQYNLRVYIIYDRYSLDLMIAPIANEIYNSIKNYEVCWHCQSKIGNYYCYRCNTPEFGPFYCSIDCQYSAWPIHKVYCGKN